METKAKIFKDNVKKVAPYVIGGVLAVETCGLLGFTPFHLDEKEKTVDIMEEIGNNNMSKTTVIDDVKGFNNVVQGYSEWIKKDDYYYRKVIIYDNFENEEVLDKIVSQEEINLRDFLGEPDIITFEKNEYISDEELKDNHSFVKATIFEDNAYTITSKESIANEIGEDLEALLILSLGLGIPYVIRKNKNLDTTKKLTRK